MERNKGVFEHVSDKEPKTLQKIVTKRARSPEATFEETTVSIFPTFRVKNNEYFLLTVEKCQNENKRIAVSRRTFKLTMRM